MPCSVLIVIATELTVTLVFIEITLEDDKKVITINQIRNLIIDSYLKPQFENYRVIVIKPADAMTISAANAFLKSLEEPQERTVFILLTDKPYKLTATVRSRCQKIVASPPDVHSLDTWRSANNLVIDAASHINLIKSSILTLKHLEDSAALKQRLACFNDWMALAVHQANPALVAAKWEAYPEIELFDWMLSWVVDIIKIEYKVQTEIIYNQDLIISLQSVSHKIARTGLFKLYDQVLRYQQQLSTQLNFQMILEDILICWQDLNRRKQHG
jgi:DNA polymerase III subunit delta'